MLYALLVAALVALDQLVKYLVVQNIPLGHHVPFLPYILDLTYVQNTGAAFSLFNEHTWILTLISLVMSVILAVALVKKFFRHPLAGRSRGQPHRPGASGLRGGYVQCAVYELCRL